MSIFNHVLSTFKPVSKGAMHMQCGVIDNYYPAVTYNTGRKMPVLHDAFLESELPIEITDQEKIGLIESFQSLMNDVVKADFEAFNVANPEADFESRLEWISNNT